MKIFLAGAVSSATKKQIDKYSVYKKVILGRYKEASLTVPSDISNFRNDCIKRSPSLDKLQIDKLMVDYDLKQVRDSDLVICDLSEQSSGMGVELGVCKENDIKVVFCFERGSYVSSMIYGAFNDSTFIEYETIEDLEKKLALALK